MREWIVNRLHRCQPLPSQFRFSTYSIQLDLRVCGISLVGATWEEGGGHN